MKKKIVSAQTDKRNTVANPKKILVNLQIQNDKLKSENRRLKDKITKLDIQLEKASIKFEKQELTFMKQKNKYEQQILDLQAEVDEFKKPKTFLNIDLESCK
jgi:predicted RNase H-like nuclease (RuvC/YqgF family)